MENENQLHTMKIFRETDVFDETFRKYLIYTLCTESLFDVLLILLLLLVNHYVDAFPFSFDQCLVLFVLDAFPSFPLLVDGGDVANPNLFFT